MAAELQHMHSNDGLAPMPCSIKQSQVELTVSEPRQQTNSRDGDPLLVYGVLAEHQHTVAWDGQELITSLHLWFERFNTEFKLGIEEFALRLDHLPAHCYGHFRYGHNGFGLKGEIALNRLYLVGNRSYSQILGTLLHESLHAWQQEHGKPGKGNYHNSEFRKKAKELGLIIDADGITTYSVESPFKTLLAQYGIPWSEENAGSRIERIPGKSKLKKWSCGCTNVRIGQSEFDALCLRCNRKFERCD